LPTLRAGSLPVRLHFIATVKDFASRSAVFDCRYEILLTILIILCNNNNIPTGRYVKETGVVTKNNITIAALRLFLLRGYKYVSLVDVATEVGITKGGIYHYFSSKEELLHEAVQLLFDHLKAKFLELFSEDKNLQATLYSIIVDEEVDHYIKGIIGIGEDLSRCNDENFRIDVMQHFPESHKRIEQDHLEICHAIEKNLHRSIQRGEIRDDLELDALAMIILTILTGQKALGIFSRDIETRKKVMKNLCKLIGIHHTSVMDNNNVKREGVIDERI